VCTFTISITCIFHWNRLDVSFVFASAMLLSSSLFLRSWHVVSGQQNGSDDKDTHKKLSTSHHLHWVDACKRVYNTRGKTSLPHPDCGMGADRRKILGILSHSRACYLTPTCAPRVTTDCMCVTCSPNFIFPIPLF
jgi:hypothetical protein